jgi:hypothetical protein
MLPFMGWNRPSVIFPTFLSVLAVAIINGAAIWRGREDRSTGDWAFIGVTGLGTIAIVAAVLWKWFRHQDGVRDWWAGGVACLEREDSRLVWSDWAILVTRRGLVHRASGRLRLETRFLCGLVPIRTVERVLSRNDRALVDHPEVVAWSRGLLALGEGKRRFNYLTGETHVVDLHQAGEEPLRLLDLGSRNLNDESWGFAEKIGRLVGQAIADVPDRRKAV